MTSSLSTPLQRGIPSRILFSALLLTFGLSVSGCSYLGFGGDEANLEETQASTKRSSSDDGEPVEEKKDEEEGPEYSEAEYLRKAESAYSRGLYSIARDHLSKLREEYPGTPFESFAQLKTADALFFARDFSAAIPVYEEFLKLHPGHEAAPYARWQIANAYREQYTGPAHDQSPVRQAQNNYERLMGDYPGSYFVALAQEGLRYCQTAVNAHEAYVADFYRRSGKEQATNVRLSEMRKGKGQAKKVETASSTKPSTPLVEAGPPPSLPTKEAESSESTLASAKPELLEFGSEGAPPLPSTAASQTREVPLEKPLPQSTVASVAPPVNAPQATVAPTSPALPTLPAPTSAKPPIQTSKLSAKQLAIRREGQNRSTCRESQDFSVAEIPFDGEFEMRINQRQGARIAADLIFETEEGSRVALESTDPNGPFTKCDTKRFSVRLGLPQQKEEELVRPIRIQFAPGIQYRIFPLESPKRLVLIAFQH